MVNKIFISNRIMSQDVTFDIDKETENSTVDQLAGKNDITTILKL